MAIGYSQTGQRVKVTKGKGYTEYYSYDSGRTVRKYDDGRPLEIKEAPPNFDKEKSKEEFSKKLYGSAVKPTKVDVKTGSGVPGGFSASSIKKPDVEAGKYSAAMASVASQLSAIKGMATSPLAKQLLSPAKSKLSKMLSGYAKKLKAAKTSAVDFSKVGSVPKLPEAPKINVPKVSLPEIPKVAAPSTPSTPSLPSVPTIPRA